MAVPAERRPSDRHVIFGSRDAKLLDGARDDVMRTAFAGRFSFAAAPAEFEGAISARCPACRRRACGRQAARAPGWCGWAGCLPAVQSACLSPRAYGGPPEPWAGWRRPGWRGMPRAINRASDSLGGPGRGPRALASARDAGAAALPPPSLAHPWRGPCAVRDRTPRPPAMPPPAGVLSPRPGPRPRRTPAIARPPRPYAARPRDSL